MKTVMSVIDLIFAVILIPGMLKFEGVAKGGTIIIFLALFLSGILLAI